MTATEARAGDAPGVLARREASCTAFTRRAVSPGVKTRRILCLKIAARGDLLLAGPAFRWLRENNRDAHISLVVGRSCEDVARHQPYFDEIWPFDDHSLFAGRVGERLRAVIQLFAILWTAARRGDAEILLLQRDWRYAMVAWLARIPRRVGFATPRSKRFLTDGYESDGKSHHVKDYLGLVAAGAGPSKATSWEATCLEGGWEFQEGERETAFAVAEEQGFGVEEGGWFALGFGGGHNVKTRTELKAWPIESYVELAAKLVERGHRVVWLGDARDGSILPPNATGVRLAGPLTVGETAAVLSVCECLVANDSFLLHLGETLGVPTVGLFGPTDPSCFGPLGSCSTALWAGTERVPCSPCARRGGSEFPECVYGHRCMHEISVENVLAAVAATPRPVNGRPHF